MRRLIVACLLLAACSEPAPGLEIRVVKAGTIDPFGAASTVRARLYDESGAVIAESSFAIAEGRGDFPDIVPFGDARAVVEALDVNGQPVSRGAGRLRALTGGDVTLTVFVGAVDAFFETIDAARLPTAMVEPVVGLTATRLDDGTVLIAGGARLGNGGEIVGVSDRAYLYDPDTGAYTELPPMKQARAGHTATKLGTVVLIAGGVTVLNDQVQASSTIELYDAAGGAFTLFATPLAAARAFHTATLLIDGGVLLAGGMQPVPQALADSPRWDQLSAAMTPTTAERFSNNPGTLVTLPAGLEAGRWGHGAVRGDSAGRVILVGGRGLDGNALASTTVFDPVDGTFTFGPLLGVARAGVAVARLDDTLVIAAGGRSDPDDATSTLASTDLINLAAGTVTDGPDLGAPRAWHTATSLTGGRVLLVGGLGSTGEGRDDAEIVSSGASTFVSSGLSRARGLHAAAFLPAPADQVLVIGGADVAGTTWTAQQSGEIFVDPLD